MQICAPPSDAGEPGGGASEGGGGAAETVPSPQPGGEGLRRGGREADHRGEEVPGAPGAAEDEAGQPDGVPRDPPVQQRRGGRDREFPPLTRAGQPFTFQESILRIPSDLFRIDINMYQRYEKSSFCEL